MGAGKVTIRRGGSEKSFGAGESFPFSLLRAGAPSSDDAVNPEHVTAPVTTSDETTRYLMQLARALDEAEEPGVKRDLIDRVHATMHELSADGVHTPHAATEQELAPYVETVIEIRNKLRDAKQYLLADEIRSRLAELDIVLEDGSAGTIWRKS
jgi:cysteinyl-tRNA synthetase